MKARRLVALVLAILWVFLLGGCTPAYDVKKQPGYPFITVRWNSPFSRGHSSAWQVTGAQLRDGLYWLSTESQYKSTGSEMTMQLDRDECVVLWLQCGACDTEQLFVVRGSGAEEAAKEVQVCDFVDGENKVMEPVYVEVGDSTQQRLRLACDCVAESGEGNKWDFTFWFYVDKIWVDE